MARRIVTIKDLAADVWGYGHYLKVCFTPSELTSHGEDEPTGDFRLQIFDGTWNTHTGDSQYDTDHAGAWGSASVPRGCTRKEAREIAKDLIEEAMADLDDCLLNEKAVRA